MPPDRSNDPGSPAPDLLHRALRNLRARPTVQALLAWGALGWAGLQFVGLVAEPWASRPTVMVSALVLYGAGFGVVALAAPVVLRGRHPARTLLVVGVTVVSLAAGFVIRGLWSPSSGDPVPSAPDSLATRSADRPPTDDPPSAVPDSTPSRPADDVPADAGPPGASGGAPAEAEAEVDPDPVDAVLARLSARYGEVDEIVVGTAFRAGGDRLFEGYDAPVAVRLYRYSAGYALNVDTGGRSERLDLSVPAARARTVVRLVTECGERRYELEAAREGETARVHIAVDSAAARRAVERARTLGECRVEGP